MVQKRETKAFNKLCVREILSLSFVCGAYFFEFRGRNLVCFGIAYNSDWGRHLQIRAGSREGTHAHCVFHACLMHLICPPTFCIIFGFHFSWVLQPSQEKLKTMLMQNFGGQIGRIMGNVEVAY